MQVFRDIMFLVWTPSPPLPPHAKQGIVSRNCDTNVHIKFTFDTTIDDLEWKNTIDFDENGKKLNMQMKKRPAGLIAPPVTN